MQRIVAWVRLVFGFSKTEANAFVVLLPLMLFIIVSEPVYQTYFLSGKQDDFKDRRELDSLIALMRWTEEDSTSGRGEDDRPVRTAHLFPFDPNKATVDQLKELGVDDRTATRIVNYRSKGGTFRVKTDLRKIYGIDTALYVRLAPHIQLPSVLKKQAVPERISRQTERFDINTADTLRLQEIYGIGPTIARRIANYRSSLGGFLDFDQLYEVWGLDSAVVRRLSEKSVIAPDFTPNRLSINQAGEKELSRHPYIRTKLARAIVNYRFQHGNFSSVDDLRKISAMDEKAFLRIKPYITLE